MAEVLGREITEWITAFPLIQEMVELKPTQWFNPAATESAEVTLDDVGLTAADIDDAAARLRRFAPYLAEVFPAARPTGGILESPLRAVPSLHKELDRHYQEPMLGNLWVKLDSQLPISGSIKARGGIYEVLQHAENLAVEHGLITLDSDYRELNTKKAREFFSHYNVAVGSTGNLGLSIGIMSAQLGFQTSVHMSADARQWKKDTLREHGVKVVEYDSDYSVAVAAGRREAESDPATYFVDDENSVSLFLGYAVAGRRLAGQLRAVDVGVDKDHPLFVYLPCGVGGGPGGVAFGLKTVFGDAVRAVFAEPTHSPAMMLGVYTGQHDKVSVQDFGIDNVTVADGLAVGRPSGFVGQRMQRLIDGYYTMDDADMFRLIALFHQAEGLVCEPSSATGFARPWHVQRATDYRQQLGLSDEVVANATHIAWVTGGSMVPEEEMAEYVRRGDDLLAL